MLKKRYFVSWDCKPCQVRGVDPDYGQHPNCWMCGCPARVVARPVNATGYFPPKGTD